MVGSEANGIAMLPLYPEGRRTLDVPRELLPREAQLGDVSEVSFAHDQQATEWMAT
ncbi:MAG TPA: hypothetical protein VE288_00950 [Rubrobacteraceae bacterium]|nr:hypothetical protein [Rubrobacteraceae bacterium]